MALQASQEHFHIPARKVRQFSKAEIAGDIKGAMDMGFGFANQSVMRDMAVSYAADAVQAPLTTPTIPGLVQFLQNWLPGQVHVMTAARKIDDLIGISTIGNWDDEQIVQEELENVGYAQPYQDDTNVVLADWSLNFVNRTVIRFELGMMVGMLEEARAARVRVNSSEAKRQSAGLNLEITRNLVGFNGYNSGNGNTYGFLNDPGLLAYTTVAATGTGSSTYWSQKTFLEIQSDLLIAINALVTQTQAIVDPETVDITLAMATNAYAYLSTTSDFGISVRKWLSDAYPKIRVVHAPQLNTANGTLNAGGGGFYLFADKLNDLSTDDGRTFIQVVPAKFMVTGVQKLAKGYLENYTNATCGTMCKRPFAVVRYSGIS